MIKKLPVFILLFTLLFTVFLQVSQVSAQEVPVTGPVTTPVTGPVTTPVQNITLFGKVVYKQLGRLFSNVNRITPAAGIVVTIQNFFNPAQKYTTTTDQNGNYGYSVPNGFYEVVVKDTHTTFFVPPFKVVKIQNNQKRLDFQGLLFPHF